MSTYILTYDALQQVSLIDAVILTSGLGIHVEAVQTHTDQLEVHRMWVLSHASLCFVAHRSAISVSVSSGSSRAMMQTSGSRALRSALFRHAR